MLNRRSRLSALICAIAKSENVTCIRALANYAEMMVYDILKKPSPLGKRLSGQQRAIYCNA